MERKQHYVFDAWWFVRVFGAFPLSRSPPGNCTLWEHCSVPLLSVTAWRHSKLSAKKSNGDVLYTGVLTVDNDSSEVLILSNDTGENRWWAPLTYLDAAVKPGDPILFKDEWCELVKWNGGSKQVTLRKPNLTLTFASAKQCHKRIERTKLDGEN